MDNNSKYKIIHINFYDEGGGAAQVSEDLATRFGHHVLAGVKKGNAPWSTEIPRRGSWFRFFRITDKLLNFIFPDRTFFKKLYSFLPGKIRTALYNRPLKIRDLFFYHNCRFHSHSNLLRVSEYRSASIVHFHNLHGGYFDLQAVHQIVKNGKKFVWTLHDMWLLTGGEAHTFGDMNFTKGDPKTPFDNTYPFPSIRFADRRKKLLRHKKKILENISGSGIIVCNSLWLERLLRESFVFNHNLLIKTIYPCIDTNVFFNEHRRTWDIVRIGFFDSGSPFKNSSQFYRVMNQLLKKTNKKIHFFIKDPIQIPDFNFSKLSYCKDHSELRKLYNDLDILIFPSTADTFPLTTLEAMACGVCVVANNVCGIPEQITHEKNGFLSGDCSDEQMVEIVFDLVENKGIEYIRQIGWSASDHVRNNFPIERTLNEYSEVYHTIEKWKN